MPSWITHLATSHQLLKEINVKDENSFIFGNIMPDILNNYIVKETSQHKDYEITHFTDEVNIHGIHYQFPNPQKFWKKYQSQKENPVVFGFYVHLLTDYFWNHTTYEKHFKKINDQMVAILADGTEKIMEYQDAIHLKQRDFRIFTEVLKTRYPLSHLQDMPQLVENSKQIIENPLTREDIQKAIQKIEQMLEPEEKTETEKYVLFTEEQLKQYFQESIQFILQHLIR